MTKNRRGTGAALHVVPAETSGSSLSPPDGLGPEARRLWDEITASYEFDDPASVEILRQAVCAVDLAEQCRREVQQSGVMVKIRGQTKENPLLKVELTARSLSARLLARLGLDLEPVRASGGRPGGLKGG